MRNVKKAGAQKGDFLNAKVELYISNLLKFSLCVLTNFSYPSGDVKIARIVPSGTVGNGLARSAKYIAFKNKNYF